MKVVANKYTLQGSSVARKFAQSYSVALLARNPANYTPIVEEITGAGGHAAGFSADVSDPTSMKDALAEIGSAFPNTNVAAAVYNVGGGFVRKPFLDMSLDEFTGGYKAAAYVEAVISSLGRAVCPAG